MEGGADQEAAFNGIVTRYYAKILKFCRYALGGNVGLAEDCTQDIFLILYENMARLKDYDNIGGWLYKTAANISKRYAATLRKERTRFAAATGASGEDETPVDSIIAKNIKGEEERIAEERAIARAAAGIERGLKPEDKEILELAFRQRRPLKEVAVRLNISLSAVKSRASRLRHKIGILAQDLL
ncbi:MAG: sigma-70 family RNA polymerase sigma factor, partial [Treponema sp.]|nr:sigma-70 family RNA polymerase sigma factor [Treponema sp.]